jgi:hypothetical protein
MPIALVRSISLPNLKIYTTISLLLVSGCFYYAFDTVRTDPQWKLHQNSSHYSISRSTILKQQQQQQQSTSIENIVVESAPADKIEHVIAEEKLLEPPIFFDEINQNETSTLVSQLKDVVQFMTHEPVCIWVSAKMYLKFTTHKQKYLNRAMLVQLLKRAYRYYSSQTGNFLTYNNLFLLAADDKIKTRVES